MNTNELMREMRAKKPLVQCLTNTVVVNFTANALLASGAAPAMIEDPEEAALFAMLADATLVNLGTVTHAQAETMRAAIKVCIASGKPWVLDPVAIGTLPLRTRLANEFKLMRPAIIRGNASEIKALAGEVSQGRGVESGDSTEQACNAAKRLAAETDATVLVTGETDYAVSPLGEIKSITGGSALMQSVTGMGCAQGAFAAAVLAVEPDPFHAAILTAELWSQAGVTAEAKAMDGIGSFQIEFLNALWSMR